MNFLSFTPGIHPNICMIEDIALPLKLYYNT